MIDWVSAVIPMRHRPINGGFVVKIDPYGEEAWKVACRVQVEGSHEDTFSIRSEGGDGQHEATELYISGNPSKYLQGHNVFGIDDLRMLVLDTFISLCAQLKVRIPPETINAIWQGNYRLTRVDINYMYALGSLSDVKSWLRAAEFKSKTRHGRPSSKSSSLYWGKHSRRWSIKAYSKGEEIKGPKSHQLAERFRSTPLLEYAQDKLRIELTLRAKELDKLSLLEADKWSIETPNKLFNDYIKRIEMNEQIELTDEFIRELPNNVRGTYINWKDGHNPRDLLSKPTFYRHRKELREYGIDINLAVEKIDRSNVIPLVRVLEATPSTIPQWAYDLGLIHGSAVNRRHVA